MKSKKRIKYVTGYLGITALLLSYPTIANAEGPMVVKPDNKTEIVDNKDNDKKLVTKDELIEIDKDNKKQGRDQTKEVILSDYDLTSGDLMIRMKGKDDVALKDLEGLILELGDIIKDDTIDVSKIILGEDRLLEIKNGGKTPGNGQVPYRISIVDQKGNLLFKIAFYKDGTNVEVFAKEKEDPLKELISMYDAEDKQGRYQRNKIDFADYGLTIEDLMFKVKSKELMDLYEFYNFLSDAGFDDENLIGDTGINIIGYTIPSDVIAMIKNLPGADKSLPYRISITDKKGNVLFKLAFYKDGTEIEVFAEEIDQKPEVEEEEFISKGVYIRDENDKVVAYLYEGELIKGTRKGDYIEFEYRGKKVTAHSFFVELKEDDKPIKKAYTSRGVNVRDEAGNLVGYLKSGKVIKGIDKEDYVEVIYKNKTARVYRGLLDEGRLSKFISKGVNVRDLDGSALGYLNKKALVNGKDLKDGRIQIWYKGEKATIHRSFVKEVK